MESSGGVTLVDELTGETVAVEPGGTVAAAIEARLAAADLPRSDFRGQPLTFQLLDPDGQPLPADGTLTAGSEVRLASPDAAAIVERRNRWLDEIGTGAATSTSVSRSTQLALVERTDSRLDDVARLRAELAAARTPPPRRSPRLRVGGLLLTLVVVAVVVAIFAAWGWWFVDEINAGRAAGGDVEAVEAGGGDRPAITVAAGPLGEEFAVEVGGPGLPGVGCETIETGDVELPAELELELSCEVAVFVFDVPEDGATVEVSARSGLGDPIVWLYDEAGVEIGFNDDTNSLDSFLSVDVAAGQHELHVGNLTGEPSAIEVTIELI